ncbi:hypothetical protein BSL78_19271 [Apostichopus japonicus]|uniref:Integrase catalytic domain-containing protein n=1 Tax=Stichopus japonicus TaxID=307972 RepID=A0A2G8K7F8_STIJA|nr:hypothetical protein BSL78_19271 [Apostichopus japonicus]
MGIPSQYEHLFSEPKNAELDEMVKAAVGKNSSYGEKMVAGLLASKNVHVQRDRIRQSIRRVDPDGVDTRKRVALHRRQYSVPGPNSLWHIDGNHKLIRWRYVIHGGIDGYSRIPVFLRCSTNNRAHTMLSAFKEGVLQYGLPWTVRSDKGGENTSVCAFMMAHPLRGPGRGPSLQEGVSTIRELKDFGEICSQYVLSSTH